MSAESRFPNKSLDMLSLGAFVYLIVALSVTVFVNLASRLAMREGFYLVDERPSLSFAASFATLFIEFITGSLRRVPLAVRKSCTVEFSAAPFTFRPLCDLSVMLPLLT